jgi:hypothetical protein
VFLAWKVARALVSAYGGETKLRACAVAAEIRRQFPAGTADMIQMDDIAAKIVRILTIS